MHKDHLQVVGKTILWLVQQILLSSFRPRQTSVSRESIMIFIVVSPIHNLTTQKYNGRNFDAVVMVLTSIPRSSYIKLSELLRLMKC